MRPLIPSTGFLGTGATFAADVNLVTQIGMGIALLAGGLLARRGCYKAHAACQTTILMMSLLLIGSVMWPSFKRQVRPAIPKRMHRLYYAVAATHAGAGVAAEGLGLYIAAVAGTRMLPSRLRFKNYRVWMRFELLLWEATLAAGIATYFAWYVEPFR